MCYLIHYCHGVPCLIELKVFCSVRAKVANNGKKLTKAEKKQLKKREVLGIFKGHALHFIVIYQWVLSLTLIYKY